MKATITILSGRRRAGAPLCACVMLLCGLSAATRGDPPIDPLPVPLCSFDRQSPSVLTGEVDADAALIPVVPDLETVFMGWAFGLGLSSDELDAQSVANADVPDSASFAFLFSVDSQTVGAATPAAEMVAAGVPYNTWDQAMRGHAAGDQFMSTTLFSRTGTRDALRVAVILNNVLIRNNFDEGGTDFVAWPETSADDIVVDVQQDSVDATAVWTSETEAIYYSVTADSPSLTGLHGRPSPSGADLFVFTPPGGPMTSHQWQKMPGGVSMRDSGPPCQAACSQQASDLYDDCMDQGGTVEVCAATAHTLLTTCLQTECGVTPPPPPGLYASALDLGLRQCDDVDGLIVFDANSDGVFNGSDQVLFSLSPESPSLATIPGASGTGAAADVFLTTPDLVEPVLFASAGDFGLGSATDNIDALDYTLCDDANACAAAHGIRINGSVPTVSAWGVVIMTLLMLGAGTILVTNRGSISPMLSPSTRPGA